MPGSGLAMVFLNRPGAVNLLLHPLQRVATGVNARSPTSNCALWQAGQSIGKIRFLRDGSALEPGSN